MTSFSDSSTHFLLLRLNLREIYTALYASQGADDLPLVANYDQTGVYYAHSWFGYALKSIYHYTYKPEEQAKYLDQSMQVIINTFDQVVKEALDARKYYRNSFKARLKDLPVEESKVSSARHFLIETAQTTFELWEVYIQTAQRQYTLPLKRLMGSKAFISNSSAYWKLKKVLHLVEIEGQLEMDLPIKPLANLALSKELSQVEDHHLKQWIKRLNRSTISSALLDSVLKEAIKIINSSQGTSLNSAMLGLKLELFKYPCQLLKEKDQAHLLWRAHHLQLGKTLSTTEGTWILGPKISRHKLANDHNHVYALANHVDMVLKTGRNTLELKIQALKAQHPETNWGIQGVTFIDVSSKGNFAILEKLYEPFDSWVWESQNFQLEPCEQERALILANHLHYMMEQNATPLYLSPHDLMFDSKGNLKTIRFLEKGPFNYNILEKFCYEVSKGNRHVAKFLMTVSRLRTHPVGLNYYYPLIGYTLKTGKTQLLTTLMPRGFEQNSIKKHAELLCQKAQVLRQETFDEVKDYFLNEREWYQSEEEEDDLNQKNQQLLQQVAEELLSLYEESAMPGILWPHLKTEVVHRFKNGMQGVKREEEQLRKMKNYYQTQFSKMKDYNTLADSIALN